MASIPICSNVTSITCIDNAVPPIISPNATNISDILSGYPGKLAPILPATPSPPWYIQYLPELILTAGIASTVLIFYFSPGLRGAVKRLFLRK